MYKELNAIINWNDFQMGKQVRKPLHKAQENSAIEWSLLFWVMKIIVKVGVNLPQNYTEKLSYYVTSQMLDKEYIDNPNALITLKWNSSCSLEISCKFAIHLDTDVTKQAVRCWLDKFHQKKRQYERLSMCRDSSVLV